MLLYQVKQALLALKQKPTFVGSVVSSMGLTLGVLLCVITLAYLLLIEPLPYPEQDKLMRVDHALFNEKGVNNLTAFTYPSLIHLYKNQTVFEHAAIINYENNIVASLRHQPAVNTAYVSPEWFPLLDAPFIHGRGFESTEAINAHNPVAILSFDTWKNEFNLDPDILTKTLMVQGVSFRVVGVLADTFIEPKIQSQTIKTDIWLPWDFNENITLAEKWGNIRPSFVFVGRLKSGMTIPQAEQQITELTDQVWRQNVANITFFQGWSIKLKLRSFQEVILGQSKNTVYFLLIGVFGLLVIASTNITNLFMSRAAQQQRTIAIHAALGAKQSQLYKHFLFETVMLMLLSICVAIVIAQIGFAGIDYYLATRLPRTGELAINGVTLTAAIIALFVLATLFAFVCSKAINYRFLNKLIHVSGKGVGSQISEKVRSAFIIIQVAVVTVIIFINVNLFKNAIDSIQQPLGFDLNNISEISLTSTTAATISRDEQQSVISGIAKQLLLLPAVKSLSQSSSPFIRSGDAAFITMDTNERLVNENRWVDHSYFQMISQPLITGRFFEAYDVKEQRNVLIINDAFANYISPNSSAVGMKLKNPGGTVFTIIGVVKGVKVAGDNNVAMRTYRPTALFNTQFLIEANENQQLSREKVIAAIQKVSRSWSLFNFEQLTHSRYKLLFTAIATAITTLVLAVVTTILSAIGLYGILSYSIKIRRVELGTRIAIGAKNTDVIKLILSSNMKPILIGIVTSAVTILVSLLRYNQYVANYQTMQLWVVFLMTLAVVFMLSFVASYLPLRRYLNQPVSATLRGQS